MTDPRTQDGHSASAAIPQIPRQTDPAFSAHSRRPDAQNLPSVLFQDDIWPLHHLDNSETQTSLNIDFRKVVRNFRLPAKVLIFNLLNTDAARRTVYIQRSRLAPSTVAKVFDVFRALAKWLTGRGINQLSDMSSADLDDYAVTVESRDMQRQSKATVLILISRIFAHNTHLTGDLHFCEPPWFGQALQDWVPKSTSSISNRTEPIEPEVLEPLLIAALRIIDAYLGGTLPMNEPSRWTQARRWASEEPGGRFAGRAALAAAATIISDFEMASKWVPCFSRSDVRGAGLIVIGYLTGVRPGELLHLTTGCLEVLDKSQGSEVGVRRYQITGRTFKGVRDASGNSLTEGVQRDQPWVTIEPVERAVRAMRRLSDSGGESELLFTRFHQTKDDLRSRRGQAITSDMANTAINGMMRTWNRRAVNDPSLRPIPDVSYAAPAKNPSRGNEIPSSDQQTGRMINGVEEVEVARIRRPPTLSRFRRTLAWHIVNRPGGVVALGVQYGHLRQVTSIGYAGRSESGFPDEIEFEQLLSSWDNLDALSAESEAGTASGPAAGRLRDEIAIFKQSFSGSVKNPKQLTRLKEAGLQRIYDNPKAMVVCVFNPATAACHEDRAGSADNNRDTPDLDNCSTSCGNIAHLDSHIAQKQKVRDDLEEEIEYLPAILADRNRRRIERFDAVIARHQRLAASESVGDSDDSAR